MARYTVKNWRTFQHYTGRRPPWIKLQRTILDDRNFQCLPIASKALAPMLWLLASESDDGSIECDPAELAWRLRWPEKDIKDGLTPLIKNGFLECASEALAECLQDACLETEGEAEVEEELAGKPAPKRRSRIPADFYPNEVGVAKADNAGVNVAIELQKFSDYHQAKGTTMLDWQAAWRTWISNAKQFGRSPNANHRNTNADTIAAFTGQRQPAVPEGGSGFVVEGCGTRV